MENVEVKLSNQWVKFARSPFVVAVTALTCLSLAFGPVFLFQLGKTGVSYGDPRVILCFAAIFLVPLVYIRFAALCLTQVRTSAREDSVRGETNKLGSVLLWMALIVAALAIYLVVRP
jgi:hypothetical protein